VVYIEFRDEDGVWGIVREDHSVEYDGTADGEVADVVATVRQTCVDTPYPPPAADAQRLMLDLYAVSSIVHVERIDRDSRLSV
jgi:hypothetical protein